MVDGASRLGHTGPRGPQVVVKKAVKKALWISWIRALVTVEELLD